MIEAWNIIYFNVNCIVYLNCTTTHFEWSSCALTILEKSNNLKNCLVKQRQKSRTGGLVHSNHNPLISRNRHMVIHVTIEGVRCTEMWKRLRRRDKKRPLDLQFSHSKYIVFFCNTSVDPLFIYIVTVQFSRIVPLSHWLIEGNRAFFLHNFMAILSFIPLLHLLALHEMCSFFGISNNCPVASFVILMEQRIIVFKLKIYIHSAPHPWFLERMAHQPEK